MAGLFLTGAFILNPPPGLKHAIAFTCSFAINLASLLPGLVLL